MMSGIAKTWLWPMNAALLIFLFSSFLWPKANLFFSSTALAIVILWPVFRSPSPANLVTAGRLLIALAAFVALMESMLSPLTAAAFWAFALALDGLDGWLARRTGGTAFGALLDMECDNVLLAVMWLAVASLACDPSGGELAGSLGPGAQVVVKLGLVIPLYRIGLVGLRALRPHVVQPPAKRLWGMPLGKVLFVAVALLSLIAVASLDGRVRGLAVGSLASHHLTLLAALSAVALSSYSFWPEYRAFLAPSSPSP